MNNIMIVDGHRAKIEYDPDIDMFRGEILGLNGGADFYGKTPDELRDEFRNSLTVFLEVCREKGVSPYKEYSGKFNLRIAPELHSEIAARANSDNKSLNQWIADNLAQLVQVN